MHTHCSVYRMSRAMEAFETTWRLGSASLLRGGDRWRIADRWWSGGGVAAGWRRWVCDIEIFDDESSADQIVIITNIIYYYYYYLINYLNRSSLGGANHAYAIMMM